MLKSLLDPSNYHYNPHAIPIMVVSLLIFAVGLMILVQTKKTVRDVSFFFFCMSSTLWLFTMGFVYCSNDPYTALRWYKTFTFFGVVNLTPTLYLFAASVSGLLHKQRFYVALTFVVTYSIYFLALTTDKFITFPHRYFWGYYPHYEPPTYVFLVTFLIVFWANQYHLKLAYEREPAGMKRKQIRTIKLSLLFGLTAFIDFTAKIFYVPVYPCGFVSMFILTCLLAYSIIRYKAFDIETVIHKTILWVLSFSIIVVPIFVVYRWALSWIGDSTALQTLFWTVSFIIFTVYLRVVQPRIDHWFQRRRNDLEEIFSRFAEDLVHLKGFDNLIRRIEETIADALYPQWVDIFIYDQKKKDYRAVNRGEAAGRASSLADESGFLTWLTRHNRIAYRDFIDIDPAYAAVASEAKGFFGKAGAAVAVPLVLNEKLLGVINLDKKANLDRYTAAEFHFLNTLKNQAAVAVSNSLIYQNIEEQVRERTAELVEMQKQLIQAEKLATVGTLSGGVAHEINNPLTAILTNVQMLLALSDDEGVRMDKEALELIEDATQRCRTIVKKLMAYSKKPMETEAFSRVDLRDVMDKVRAFLGYQLEQDGVTINVHAADGPYDVMGNHNELEQVLTNLIINARDAILLARKGGAIEVSLTRARGRVQIAVKDEGVGMPEDVQRRIFDPFFTTKDVGKGLGLGLPICQSIMEKHQGRITVESVPGAGATFMIDLPQDSPIKEPARTS